MAISPGQPVSAAVVNAEFASKVDNTTLNGIVTFGNTTDSTDKDTGGAVFNGGVGIEKNLNVGGELKVDSLTGSSNKDSGALVVKNGGLGVEENINAGGNIVAAGTMSASNLSGSNSGDVSLLPVGASPNANGASLTGQVLTLQPASAAFPGVVDNGVQVFSGDKTFQDDVTISSDLIVNGNATFNGTLTSISTTNTEIEDKNVTLNKGGNDATSEGAGLTVERTGTNGSLIYANAVASKFKIGALGSEIEIADVSSSQTLTNKTINAGLNTITGITNASIDASAGIQVSKLESLTASKALVTSGLGVIETSATSSAEIGYLQGTTSNIQAQLNALAVSGWKKYQIAHTALQAASLTNSIVIDTFTDMVISGVIVDHSVQAAGTGITEYKISVGLTGEAERYCPKKTVSSPVSSTDHFVSSSMDIPLIGSSYQIKLFAESIGANLDQSTAGMFVIYLKMDKIP